MRSLPLLLLLAAALAPAQELGLHELLSHRILAPNQPVVEVKAYTAQRVPPLKIPTARADWEAYTDSTGRPEATLGDHFKNLK